MKQVPGGWRRLLQEVPGAVRRTLLPAPVPAEPPPWWGWRHVTKLDPDKPLTPAALECVLASGTDAVVVGGTQGITQEKVLTLLERLRGAPFPVALEVSDPSAAVPGAAVYLIPLVLNAGDPTWVGQAQATTLARLLPAYSRLIPWERMWPAAYLVQNPASAVGTKTGARPVNREEAAGYGALAGRLWRLPLIYVEYSGCYGDPALVAAVRQAAGPGVRVWYGGGIDNAQKACAMAQAAHTLVVGNAAHAAPQGLADLVRATRQAHQGFRVGKPV